MHRFIQATTAATVVLLGLACSVQAQVPKEAPTDKATEKAKAKVQPLPIPAGVRAERDLEYARVGDTPLRLDLYRPETSGELLPLVVWVHGGGWVGGDKANPMALPLSGQGYVVASVNYRLSGVASFPAQIEDCRAAIRWLRANASAYNIDPKRIGVWGSSAGGHLVALLGTAGDETRWDTVGGSPDQSARVQAVCDYYGPANFLVENMPGGGKGPESPVGRLLGGPVDERKEEARQASPVTYVSRDDPPFLIFHGDKDATVPIEQSEMLEAALKDAGVDAAFVRVKDAGHGFRPGCDPSPEQIRAQVAAFFDKHLKGNRPDAPK
jgi:acetyl esterase/lipase